MAVGVQRTGRGVRMMSLTIDTPAHRMLAGGVSPRMVRLGIPGAESVGGLGGRLIVRLLVEREAFLSSGLLVFLVVIGNGCRDRQNRQEHQQD